MTHWLGLPILASDHGPGMDQVMLLIHLVMLVAFVVWAVFFVVPLIRFRRRKSPKADYRGLRTSLPYVLVAAVAVAEVVILLGFSLPFWESQVNAMPEDSDDRVELRVIAQQFQWNIHYPGADRVFGRTVSALMDDEVNPIGLDPEDDFGKDDIVALNQLHLPVNQLALIHLTSKDVIHSFSLPEFRVKQDIIPGMSIPVHFIPNMTTETFRQRTGDEDRNFEIACAQLCGASHYRMRGFVTIESEEAFQAWLAQQLEYRQTGEDDWF